MGGPRHLRREGLWELLPSQKETVFKNTVFPGGRGGGKIDGAKMGEYLDLVNGGESSPGRPDRNRDGKAISFSGL